MNVGFSLQDFVNWNWFIFIRKQRTGQLYKILSIEVQKKMTIYSRYVYQYILSVKVIKEVHSWRVSGQCYFHQSILIKTFYPHYSLTFFYIQVISKIQQDVTLCAYKQRLDLCLQRTLKLGSFQGPPTRTLPWTR